MKIPHKRLILAAVLGCMITGCRWQDEWLDVKRNKNDVMPSTLEDFQAILNYDGTLNQLYPMLAMACTDNMYVPKEVIGSLSEFERNSYTFASNIFGTVSHVDFSNPYIRISYANIALEGVEKTGISGPEPENIKGQALFFRAFCHYYLAEVYGNIYDKATASKDLGIQLRLTSDPNAATRRASVAETYDQILADLTGAAALLPERSLYITRPSKASAYAMLAKVHLSMGDYEKAVEFAGKALDIKSSLLDFTSDVIDPKSTYTFPNPSTGLNPEIIFYATNAGYSSLRPAIGVQFVDTLLYKSYAENDLRKTLFYREDAQGRARFAGTYTATFLNFGGIAVNELLLISAECKSRLGDWEGGMADLNRLLGKRFAAEFFAPLEARDRDEALRLVLEERRKELPFTGIIRWQDLRRLNKEPEFAKSVIHISEAGRLELPPGDRKYVLPIPDTEIQLSGIEQNPR